MTFDERFDERTERQHGEALSTSVFEREPDQPIAESTALEALINLGVDERDQPRTLSVGGEADDLAVARQLVALTLRRISHLDALSYSHT